MLPSRKIFIGVSAICSGFFLGSLVDLQTLRAVESVSAAIGQGTAAGMGASGTSDALLEQAHSGLLTSLIGTAIDLVLIFGGMILLIVGLYQAARLAEQAVSRLDNPRS